MKSLVTASLCAILLAIPQGENNNIQEQASLENSLSRPATIEASRATAKFGKTAEADSMIYQCDIDFQGRASPVVTVVSYRAAQAETTTFFIMRPEFFRTHFPNLQPPSLQDSTSSPPRPESLRSLSLPDIVCYGKARPGVVVTMEKLEMKEKFFSQFGRYTLSMDVSDHGYRLAPDLAGLVETNTDTLGIDYFYKEGLPLMNLSVSWTKRGPKTLQETFDAWTETPFRYYKKSSVNIVEKIGPKQLKVAGKDALYLVQLGNSSIPGSPELLQEHILVLQTEQMNYTIRMANTLKQTSKHDQDLAAFKKMTDEGNTFYFDVLEKIHFLDKK
ncbi:MAG: hypothetical protein V1743_04400 [Nanoarchaeota archaeon]